MNCGSFIRRKMDEIHYRPQVGLLYKSGLIVPHELDCSDDKFLEVSSAEKVCESVMDIGEFLSSIRTLEAKQLIYNFGDAVKEFCQKNNVSEHIRSLLSEVME